MARRPSFERIDLSVFAKQWQEGMTAESAAIHWHVSVTTIRKFVQHHSLVRPAQYCRPGRGYEPVDPTPDEIDERCEQIQKAWTEEEEMSRRVMKPVETCLASFGWRGDGFRETELPPVELPVSSETCTKLNKAMYESGMVEKFDLRRSRPA